VRADECHRGGANNESNWRGILEYFSPAVQIGLASTPKRTDNVDTYNYFGWGFAGILFRNTFIRGLLRHHLECLNLRTAESFFIPFVIR